MNTTFKPSLCDHCGDVMKALTRWPIEVHRTCNCKCHDAWHYDQQRLKNMKKKTKK